MAATRPDIELQPTVNVKTTKALQTGCVHIEQMIDVLGPEKRRRRTTQEKIAIVQQSFEPGMTVSLVARQHGVAASQLFLWRKQYQERSLTAVAAGEQVVPASELAAAMKQIKELQRLLGKKRWKMNSLKKPLNMGVQKSG